MATPFLSLIVPVFGSPDFVEPCLASIRKSNFADYEILVADDASPDAAAILETATRYGAHVVRLERKGGLAAVRNRAAQVACGEVLVFFDSNVTVREDTLARIAEAFVRDPALVAPTGAYDRQPGVQGALATFRILLHIHVHRSSHGATTFFAGCEGVRRHSFHEMGGFDESCPTPLIEDAGFGVRPHNAGGVSLLYTDTVRRAMKRTSMMLRHGLPRDLNFRWQDRLCVLLAAVFPALAFLGLRFGPGWALIAAGDIMAIGLLQLKLFGLLSGAHTRTFALACFPLYLVDLWAGATGFVIGLWRWETSRDRWFPWVAMALALLVFGGVQAAGGAYAAEFDGAPDESSHFMTGLMIRDYMVQWPRGNPVAWAGQYYLHYPKVAFGQWPPLFHLTEAVLWLFLPPSRISGMLLVGLLGWLAAVCFYRLARSIVPPLAALAVAGVLVATPVFQASASQQMTELLILFFGLLLMDSLVRFLRTGAAIAFAEAGLWCGLGLLVHGTGICLVPACFLAVLPGGRWRRIPIRTWAWYVAFIFLGLLWYPFQASSNLSWAGVGRNVPLHFDLLLSLAGIGMAVLAGLGILTLFRTFEPVAVVSAAMVVSLVGVAYVLRAIREPRHFILALPALLLLSLAFVRFVVESLPPPFRTAGVLLCAVAGLTGFPWSRYRQEPVGYQALARQIRQPARMLVSSRTGWEEGPWIVAESLRENRPASVIMRATKILARSTWNGGNYQLLAATPRAVEAILGSLGVETIIVDEHSVEKRPDPHHEVLRATLAGNSEWSECGRSADLFAYCRNQPARVRREPLRLDLRWSSGPVIVEK